jgi:phage gp36-like protein
MAYCTESDMNAALGGAAIAVQLLDKNNDGVADSELVSACLGRATAEMSSRIQVVIDLAALDVNLPYPDALVYHTADVAAYHAWLSGATGQTMPDAIQKKRDDSIAWAEAVARGTATLGRSPLPASGQLAEQIDRNPTGAYPQTPTWRSMVGTFW